jgi:nucleotide-binding universal stress UspA family protein
MIRSEPTSHGVVPAAPFARILCAVNGSRPSLVAIAQALALAGTEGEVRFIAVCNVRGVGATEMAGLGVHHAEDAIDRARRQAREAGVRATAEVLHRPDPRRTILEEARSSDLLVLGTHTHSRAEGILLGGSAALALHACEVPVLVARRTLRDRLLGSHVLLASDGSPRMRHAAEVAGAIARRDGGYATLIHASAVGAPQIKRELAQEATDLYAATGTEPVVLTEAGRPADVIVAAGERYEATLIVVGSRGLSGLRALASVSERVGSRARCPVLVMRTGSAS